MKPQDQTPTVMFDDRAHPALLAPAQGGGCLALRIEVVVHPGRVEPARTAHGSEAAWLSILCEALLPYLRPKVPLAEGQTLLAAARDNPPRCQLPALPNGHPGPTAVSVQDVNDALRHVDALSYLGRHPLTALRCVTGSVPDLGATHIGRGRALRAMLVEMVEMLRPAPVKPPDPLPRDWYGYSILRDAYFEDVPNRQIMARLYISEGTFNRSRRAAIDAIARALAEREAALW
jgi:hypothetical protein